MVFSDPTNKQGIVQDVRFITGTNSSTYPLEEIVRNSNRALDKVSAMIVVSDGRWQWDDNNFVDYPIATTDLVANQREYVLSNDFQVITRVEWIDQNDNDEWVLGRPIDQRDIKVALEEFNETPSQPIYYDKLNDSLFLYPTPDYNATGGLKVYYQRNGSYFTSNDTVKEPGFDRQFHRLISLYVSHDYALARKQELITPINNQIVVMEGDLREHYGKRAEDEPKVIKSVYKTSR